MKNIIIICTVLFASILTGCNNWLDVQPTDRQTDKQIFSTKGGFYSTINGIYTRLNNSAIYGDQLSFGAVEILAKKYAINSGNEDLTALNEYKYSEEKVALVFDNMWKYAYETIINCNVILANLETQKSLFSEKEYKIIKGELLGVRAFIHFDLLRLFGPIYSLNPESESIPYRTTPILEATDLLKANDLINNYLLKDIKEAEALLKENDPVITEGRLIEEIENGDNALRFRQLRFNYYALMTLKARVELYAGDTDAALLTAKSVIESDNAKANFPFVDPNTILGNTNTPDRMFSTESFFGLLNAKRETIFTTQFNPLLVSEETLLIPRSTFVQNSVFNGVTDLDYRYKSQWAILSTTGDVTTPTLTKFEKIEKSGDKELFYSTFVTLIRFSELYLIAAECEKDFSSASNYLKTLVAARGINNLVINTPSDLSAAITKEYLREFYGEGQMFFYYKRKNMNITTEFNGHNTNTYYLKSIPTKLVVPLPASEKNYRK